MCCIVIFIVIESSAASHGSMIMWTDHCKFMKDAGAGTREAGVSNVCSCHQGAEAQSLPATDIINVSDT